MNGRVTISDVFATCWACCNNGANGAEGWQGSWQKTNAAVVTTWGLMVLGVSRLATAQVLPVFLLTPNALLHSALFKT